MQGGTGILTLDSRADQKKEKAKKKTHCRNLAGGCLQVEDPAGYYDRFDTDE